VQVRVSPTKTKVFGVLPISVRPGGMEQGLKDLGYNFEVLGMNVTEAQLVELTQNVRPLITPP
jgi:hypothetical protein